MDLSLAIWQTPNKIIQPCFAVGLSNKLLARTLQIINCSCLYCVDQRIYRIRLPIHSEANSNIALGGLVTRYETK